MQTIMRNTRKKKKGDIGAPPYAGSHQDIPSRQFSCMVKQEGTDCIPGSVWIHMPWRGESATYVRSLNWALEKAKWKSLTQRSGEESQDGFDIDAFREWASSEG